MKSKALKQPTLRHRISCFECERLTAAPTDLEHFPHHNFETLRRGRVVEDNINNNDQPWGRKGTLPYTLAGTAKSRPSPTSILTTKRGGKEEKDACCLPWLGCLATYVGY